MLAFVSEAARGLNESEVTLAYGHLRRFVGRLVVLFVDVVVMEIGNVAGIDSALDSLCPIVLLQTLRYQDVLARDQRPLELLHIRCRFRRPHISPDAAAGFSRWIRPQLDLVFEAELAGFVWHI